jgi:hypothetical protein
LSLTTLSLNSQEVIELIKKRSKLSQKPSKQNQRATACKNELMLQASRTDCSDAAPTMMPQQAQARDIGQHSSENDTNDSSAECSMCDNGPGTTGSCTSSSICHRSRVHEPGGSKFSNDNTGNGPQGAATDTNTDKPIFQLTKVNTDPIIIPSPSSSSPIVSIPTAPFLALFSASSPLPCSTTPAACSASPTTTCRLFPNDCAPNDITGSGTSSTNTSSINGSSSDHYRTHSPSDERDNSNAKGTSPRDDSNSTDSINSPLSDLAAY